MLHMSMELMSTRPAATRGAPQVTGPSSAVVEGAFATAPTLYPPQLSLHESRSCAEHWPDLGLVSTAADRGR